MKQHPRPSLETLEERTVPSTTAANFSDGVWRWDSGSGWLLISNQQASQLAVDNGGSVVGTFADGLWRWSPGSGWALLTTLLPEDFEVAGDNGAIYGDFGANGTWRWGPELGWIRITEANADAIAVSESDSFFGTYSGVGQGTWNWTPEHGWALLTQARANTFVATDDGDLAAVFTTDLPPAYQGLWRWHHHDGWQYLTGVVPQNFVVADENIYGDFGSAGLWQFDEDGDAHQLTTADPTALVPLDDGSVWAVFGTQAWYWSENDDRWYPVNVDLTGATQVAVGQDGDLFLDYGMGGLYRLGIPQGFVQISTRDGSNLASQDGTYTL